MAYIGKIPAAAALTSSDIADSIITEAKMADDAISLTELKAGTDGEIISWDASGNPVAIGAGTSGHFLKSQGAGSQPVFAAASAAGLVKLLSTTISSGVAAVAFDNNYITSTYDNYKLICYGLSTASDNQDIGMRMSVDNGSNFATHVGSFNYTHINDGTANQTGSSGNYGYIPFGSDEEADASGGTNVDVTIWNVNSTAQYKFVSGLITTVNQSGPNYYGFRIHGYIASNTAVNYLKVFTNVGGNLDGGTCTLYGISK